MIQIQIFVISILGLIIFLFYLAFEKSHPSALELVLIAELSAFCICARALFSFVPYFNPVMALIILSSLALGSVKGFMIGSLTALLSNFIFGQGIWTLYQMASWGLLGAIFGFVQKFLFREKSKKSEIGFIKHLALWLLSGIAIIFFTGPLTDLSGVFMFGLENVKSLFVLLAAGFFMNLTLALSTILTLVLFFNPFMFSMQRVLDKMALNENLKSNQKNL
ncbi:ECF transporter S component [Treponema pectinovorum]|uniref:ECF transporter S component n=1 Tax=Treponema pectinovorum TaxID=164 RepID=UPI0011CB9FF5|nr:ECF transporter S component [Treponema pectinovorum]